MDGDLSAHWAQLIHHPSPVHCGVVDLNVNPPVGVPHLVLSVDGGAIGSVLSGQQGGVLHGKDIISDCWANKIMMFIRIAMSMPILH